ncbi:hypothetical protein RhiirA1_483256 [Rhizophagus irregularis]|uniref:Uncharacterized protein n=1 Tax=Rhizophagus irregularis TaxID=588596 RepID=A0A2N0QKS5_9GLOM|nr:hypothetical protein RhiirA1_483256 [Rhizophagus irregularis]
MSKLLKPKNITFHSNGSQDDSNELWCIFLRSLDAELLSKTSNSVVSQNIKY